MFIFPEPDKLNPPVLRLDNVDLGYNDEVELALSDVEIKTKDIEGWVVANEGLLTVALDVQITEDLKKEAVARELVNRIQNIRKDSNFEVTDNIVVDIENDELLAKAVEQFKEYIEKYIRIDINRSEKSKA